MPKGDKERWRLGSVRKISGVNENGNHFILLILLWLLKVNSKERLRFHLIFLQGGAPPPDPEGLCGPPRVL